MLAVLIFTSLYTLAVMNYAIWKPPANKGGFTVIELLTTLAIMAIICSGLFTSELLVQLAISILGMIGLVIPRYGRHLASLVTIVACVVPWVMLAGKVSDYRREIDSLREANPFVSIEERLPIPKPADAMHEPRLIEIEKQIDSHLDSSSQPWQFERLHSERVKDFAMTPGFGVGRMVRTPLMLQSIRRATRVPEPIPQPGTLRDDIDPTGDALPDAKVRDFFGFHAGSIGSFVNFKGFGYLKSRREVAGFVPHAFESEPKPNKPYVLERLELVGLVRNPEPAVYVSESLPRMTELDAVTTRPADGFEAAGLKKLAAGEDMVANAVGSKVRLLGAIRNMTACVECHGGQRGDLLGAFSYRLAETK